ncbi:MAG: cyclic nucleotide-binding domain-containing protein [Hallerella sp.]|jgi:CRP-like cAMP-binding protein|nr:cyclic nucleotide-binding domain-containing protein [Fibrobacter sp.]MDY6368892.1 cyclic nucleotide-binding domain-containing protein [Fibrobacter sp.]MDY6388790.1 cyclic nucleotide-binding domain-containing protein [Fibrobacter sp.]MEE3339699.1 cyclic nucleotide-binding domain-containing protein [Hallerella sp.]
MTVHSSIGDWISASYEREVPFLQQIPRESADFFLLNSEIREYEAGDVIITGDREGESFCVLQSGRAQICGKTLADGRCNSLGWLDAGACFGEMSILCNEKTSNTVIALEDCTVLHLSRESFIKFLEKNPSIMVCLYKIAADRLRVKNQALDEFESLSLLASAKVLPFIDFAQTLEKSHVTGTVLFECNGATGFIAFKEGRICCAKSGRLTGPDALELMLSWSDDTLFKLDTHLMPDTINISQQSDTTSLILDALRNIDEKQSQQKN